MRASCPAIALLISLVAAGCVSTANPKARPAPTLAGAFHVDVPSITRPQGENAAWWFRAGAAQAAARGAMSGRAKNVILFIGDGMSLTTVTAARIFEGQRKGGAGEDHLLAWEGFPHTALVRTYTTDAQTPDSAGTTSAIVTGVKTRNGVLGIAQTARRKDCAGALAAPLLSLWELASHSGMTTGVVTTTRVSHATPAATFAHSAERNWENDAELPDAARAAGCTDIARQLVETPFARGFDVLMGGGRRHFMPVSQRDPEHADKSGERMDQRDLVAEWKQRHAGGVYVWNQAQLDVAPVDAPLLGLFQHDHMQFEHDRAGDVAGEPSLAAMTLAAISRLSRNPAGYLLLVEAGRIDHAHHNGNAHRALTDTVAMSDAVRAAIEAVSPDDTLILVTADHSHTLTFAGYPMRGNPILGKVMGVPAEGQPAKPSPDALGQPYTTLGYANGPGYTGASATQAAGSKTHLHDGKAYQPATGRPDLRARDTTHPDYLQESTVPLANETHGGDDVGLWATGPGSHAVRGSLEQNAIFHLMLQSTPRLRAALCAKGGCDANGVPVTLPDPAAFKVDVR